ncbi:MAG: hypothetical protein DRN30_04900 [Thermoplasmata archaeon]|nr:hypothetical protein [Euryarchaeota archaeon]RLF64901.1 MAG: hypothetical protein DRN30_04900 [Thermoplasmata archaeon]
MILINGNTGVRSMEKTYVKSFSELLLKLSKEEKDLIRELAVSYYGDIPEVNQIVYVLEDPTLRLPLSRITFKSIDTLAYYLAEHAERQYGIPIGFTENFYRIVLNVLSKSKRYTSKFWHILEMGFLPEDLSMVLGREFFRKFSIVPEDLTEIMHIIRENKLIDPDGKNLLKASIYLAVGNFRKFKESLKALEGLTFDGYSASTALAIKTLSGIYLNYIPEISYELEGAPYKAYIVGKSWLGILEILKNGTLSNPKEFSEILEAKPYELILISPWVYTLTSIFKAMWALKNSSQSLAIRTLSRLDSLLPDKPYFIKTTVLAFLTVLSREYSEEKVFLHRYYKLKSLVKKLMTSRELYGRLSLVLIDAFALMDPEEEEDYEVLQGVKILKETFSDVRSTNNLSSRLTYIEMLRKLKVASILYEDEKYERSASISDEVIMEAERLGIDHILGRALVINVKSKIKLLEEEGYKSINEIIFKINKLNDLIKRLEKICTRVQNVHLKNEVEDLKRHMNLVMTRYRDIINIRRKFKGRREFLNRL